MSTARIEIEDVRAALTAQAVVDAYGWVVRREGAELVSCACPARADHSRDACKINSTSGLWQCFPCSTNGDLFDFIAGCERLSVRDDFAAVLAKAAEIAGVGPSTATDDERAAKRAEYAQRRVDAEQRALVERQALETAAVPTATAYWQQLATTHPRGEAYLAERGLAALLTTKEFSAVRFDLEHAGSPTTILFSSDGQIRNVVARCLPELGEPKTPGLYKCPSAGTFINAVCQIRSGIDVVMTEGVMDSLTARLMWPRALVLGAHGAGNLPKIAQAAGKAIVDAGTRLLLVPHQDRAGIDAACKAGTIAAELGLSQRKGSLVIVDHGRKDLNDAWRCGWRAYS